jgi:hypothetical protein
VLYWVECLIPMILILRVNANISVWMFRYLEPRLNIEVECYMLFGWSKCGIVVETLITVLYSTCKNSVRQPQCYSTRDNMENSPQHCSTDKNYFIPNARNFHFPHKNSRIELYLFVYASTILVCVCALCPPPPRCC